MTFEIIFVLLALLGMVIALVLDKMRPGMVLFSVVVLFLCAGILTPKEMLEGFSNKGMITVAMLFLVSEGIRQSGALGQLIKKLLPQGKTTVFKAQLRMLPTISFISAFLNNTPVVVIFAPIIKRWAESVKLPATKFLIPLSYVTILGGICTLIGTSTNLVVHGMILDAGYEGFTMFELGKVGIFIAITGIIYLFLFSSRLLPDVRKDAVKPDDEPEEHSDLHRVEAVLGPRFPGINKKLKDFNFKRHYGAEVKEIKRNGQSYVQDLENEYFREGDTLVVMADDSFLAIILVDARTGVITQTRRHTFLVSLLGIKHVVLAVNKMDLVDFSEERFNEIVGEYKKFIAPLGIPDVTCIPLSALDGDNVVEKSERTPWYNGTSLLDFLETVPIDNDHNLKDFRFPVQYVLRPNLDFRGFCGKVASGIIRKGDEVMALPSGKKSRVKSIVTYDGELDYAFPPQSVTLTLEDEIDVSRGEMLVHPDNLPMMERNFEAMVVWMDEEPMDVNKSFFIKQTTNLSRTRIDNIKYKVDVNTMEKLSLDNGRLTKETLPMQLNQIARVVLTTAKELFFDPYQTNKATGSFILIDPITNNTSAVGMIIDRVEDKDMHVSEELPVLDLPKLGIAPEHYEAVEKAVKELERQGVAVIIKK